MLTKLEKRILASIQGDISITKQPYLEIAEQLGISENTFLKKLKDLCGRGVIRRFGATIWHQKSGFKANAMVAWKVDEKRIDEVGKKMASFRQVSHCYKRNPKDDWPYNLYTMIHAKDEESCRKTARKMSEATSINTYTLLFSREELKKTSMEYFPQDNIKQKSEVRSQKSEVRSQKSEVGSQKSEVGSQRSEVRGRKSEVRGRRSEGLVE